MVLPAFSDCQTAQNYHRAQAALPGDTVTVSGSFLHGEIQHKGLSWGPAVPDPISAGWGDVGPDLSPCWVALLYDIVIYYLIAINKKCFAGKMLSGSMQTPYKRIFKKHLCKSEDSLVCTGESGIFMLLQQLYLHWKSHPSQPVSAVTVCNSFAHFKSPVFPFFTIS